MLWLALIAADNKPDLLDVYIALATLLVSLIGGLIAVVWHARGIKGSVEHLDKTIAGLSDQLAALDRIASVDHDRITRLEGQNTALADRVARLEAQGDLSEDRT